MSINNLNTKPANEPTQHLPKQPCLAKVMFVIGTTFASIFTAVGGSAELAERAKTEAQAQAQAQVDRNAQNEAKIQHMAQLLLRAAQLSQQAATEDSLTYQERNALYEKSLRILDDIES